MPNLLFVKSKSAAMSSTKTADANDDETSKMSDEVHDIKRSEKLFIRRMVMSGTIHKKIDTPIFSLLGRPYLRDVRHFFQKKYLREVKSLDYQNLRKFIFQ